MNDYVICTDTACDISASLLREWGVEYLSMSFSFDEEKTVYANNDMSSIDFYNRMRCGGIARTAAVNPGSFGSVFERILKKGKDVLYLGLSGALSTTYNAALIATDELRPVYPERRIMTIDTLSASAGEGLLVYLAVQKKKSGASMEETAAYIEELKPRICHRFVVDDLVYLKRGGRVSPAVAFAGSILGIKPILYVNEEGKPINVAKVRGRKAAMTTLLDTYGALAEQPGTGPVFISHADCRANVETLAADLKSEYGVEVNIITDIGPVLGAHTGPGAVALFFIGTER